ncbi:hypothetical protein BDD12DRAFT_875005 [Trichophaea hybrida]|nr:hypothetical protein BDD12DRAFT_875005 [Trichophaea hybrida]
MPPDACAKFMWSRFAWTVLTRVHSFAAVRKRSTRLASDVVAEAGDGQLEASKLERDKLAQTVDQQWSPKRRKAVRRVTDCDGECLEVITVAATNDDTDGAGLHVADDPLLFENRPYRYVVAEEGSYKAGGKHSEKEKALYKRMGIMTGTRHTWSRASGAGCRAQVRVDGRSSRLDAREDSGHTSE